MFKLKDRADGCDKEENIIALKAKLEALPAQIEEIKSFEVGVNTIEAGVAYDLVLVSLFESKEALFSYQNHPEHLLVASFVGKVCDSRVVVDYVP
jgi:hypothetical protein